jgi:hypothetical protein
MATENQSQASLNEIRGEVADAELGTVSGGDKATTTKTTTKPTTKPTEFFVVTIRDALITS